MFVFVFVLVLSGLDIAHDPHRSSLPQIVPAQPDAVMMTFDHLCLEMYLARDPGGHSIYYNSLEESHRG